MKKPISIQDTVKELEIIFNIKSISDRFYINKKDISREQVISMLQEFFKDKYIENGMCKIRPITMVFTSFDILEIENK